MEGWWKEGREGMEWIREGMDTGNGRKEWNGMEWKEEWGHANGTALAMERSDQGAWRIGTRRGWLAGHRHRACRLP